MSVTLELPLALHILDSVLAESKYIASNDKATDADATVAKALGSAPSAEFANVAKWFSEVKPAEAAPAAEAADEDDIDLFGSDDEEVDEEAERIKAQLALALDQQIVDVGVIPLEETDETLDCVLSPSFIFSN
ncbi:Putative Elongation factor 1-beta [Rhizopus microsporus]|nr:Putative Elongation factor 1-beta [Rhizopus microsporus]